MKPFNPLGKIRDMADPNLGVHVKTFQAKNGVWLISVYQHADYRSSGYICTHNIRGHETQEEADDFALSIYNVATLNGVKPPRS